MDEHIATSAVGKSTAGTSQDGFFRAIGRSLTRADTWVWFLLAVGALFRVAEYSKNRGLYQDEAALMRNLEGLAIFDFTTRLAENQLAAPGFLMVERIMVRLPLKPIWAARSIPFVCAIASLFLMRSVARRFVVERAVPLAVGLYAFDDWLIYYSCEMKQYTSDLMLTLCALWLVSEAQASSRRRWLVLSAFGAIGVWFSHPLALVLGAIGTYLLGRAARHRDWKMLYKYLIMISIWVVSFGCCYHVSHRILSEDRFIWDWWHFAFLPIPPRSFADSERVFWHVLNLFNSPSWVLTPLGVLASAFLAAGLYAFGVLSLLRRWRGGAFLLVAPLVFTLGASALHQYPFHGRLLIFLVPTVHLLVAEGAAVLTRHRSAFLATVVTIFLLVQPAGQATWNQAIVNRLHGYHDSHGDLFGDLLDYMDGTDISNPTVRRLPRRRSAPE